MIMKVLTKFVDWMFADSFVPFIDANNITTVFLITVVVGVLIVCVNPRLRKFF